MYWPLSAPRIYSANIPSSPPSALNSPTTYESDDGLPSPGAEQGEQHEDNSNAGTEHDTDGETSGKHSEMVRESKGKEREDGDAEGDEGEGILDIQVSRNGFIFATITRSDLTIWQSRPIAVVAHVRRSKASLETYGPNVALLIRPDAQIFVLWTTMGYLVTYSLAMDPSATVYKPTFMGYRHHSAISMTPSLRGERLGMVGGILPGAGESDGAREFSVRFRMIIKVDAGIERAMALEEELLVVTEAPTAVQCIRWTPDSRGTQTTTELCSRMEWLERNAKITDMVHDRAMNMNLWVTADGRAYVVQRKSFNAEDPDDKTLFRGSCFHLPASVSENAVKGAINARFSLFAVACRSGGIFVYKARDSTDKCPLNHTIKPLPYETGQVTFVAWSPDGYALFVGYEKGWAMWSVFGKPGATSFVRDAATSKANPGDAYLDGLRNGCWLAGGQEMLLICEGRSEIWVQEMARSTATGCLSAANIARAMLQTTDKLLIYRGYDQADLSTVSNETSVSWSTVTMPSVYLIDNWPIRSAVIAPDGRYVAIAGRRGLAHYSVNSGRWKTFNDREQEQSFVVRGGMCWFQHVLIAAVESDGQYEVRLYSRETQLDNNLITHLEIMEAPIVLMTLTGEESLLVYTQDNSLHHFVIVVQNNMIRLSKVGQLAFQDLISNPSRVRGLSWILPDEQRIDGDPSRDVAVATLLFLIDGSLLSLQPSFDEDGGIQYEMRKLHHSVEYYILMRDQPQPSPGRSTGDEPLSARSITFDGDALSDSIWLFDGKDMRVWLETEDIIIPPPTPIPNPIILPIDPTIYPLSLLPSKALLLALEPDLTTRASLPFTFSHFLTRTQPFLPALLRHALSHPPTHPPATRLQKAHLLASPYTQLKYFPHLLEVLLHQVLDDEIDAPPTHPLLPTLISFLRAYPCFHTTVLHCTRKTEIRSWRHLFDVVGDPYQLFRETLDAGELATAGGYLLVVQSLYDDGPSLSSSSSSATAAVAAAAAETDPDADDEAQSAADPTGWTASHAEGRGGKADMVALMRRAVEKGEWGLCMEVARFLVAVEGGGEGLRGVLREVGVGGYESAVEVKLDTVPKGRGRSGSELD